MKKFILIVLLQILCAAVSFAQEPARPFQELNKLRKEHGWSESRVELSKLFQKERARLGKDFEAELWKYLGNDKPKYLWTALFLESKIYLHDNPPLPELAYAIRVKMLDIKHETLPKNAPNYNADKPDPAVIVSDINAYLLAAISAEKLGKKESVAYKERAETLLKENSDLRDYLPNLRPYDLCVYKNIGTADKCKDDGVETDDGQKRKSSISNGRLLYVPKPARKGQTERGSVQVKVIVDGEGNVMSAEPLSGPEVYYQESIKAAMQAKFTPTTWYGRPWNVSGLIVFNF
jgi:hypothetical protein